MKIALIIIGLSIANILLFTAVYMHQQHKNFRRYLKDGDIVDRYDGNVRRSYLLEKHGEIWSEIRNEHTGNIIKEYTINLHPNFWYQYKFATKREKVDLTYGKKED